MSGLNFRFHATSVPDGECFCWLWFFGTLVPFHEYIQLFIQNSATKHRTYLASKFDGFGNGKHKWVQKLGTPRSLIITHWIIYRFYHFHFISVKIIISSENCIYRSANFWILKYNLFSVLNSPVGSEQQLYRSCHLS